VTVSANRQCRLTSAV